MTDTKTLETSKFGAEVGKVLNLMIHSLYTNKDIFLRELISNSSDALDKVRYLSLSDGSINNHDLKIKITINNKDNILTIEDNGIGMNKEDLINNLGTIASSGTQKFLESLDENDKKNSALIGQFGVGFYSAYMVADKIEVISRKNGEDNSYYWVSDGQESFSIGEPKTEIEERGTKISLHLKEGAHEYLDKHRIKHIIKTYSDHIDFPIELIDEESQSEIINSSKSLWTIPKSKINDEQYHDFYRQISHSPDMPWETIHNFNEGTLQYTNLLFIPSKRPFDLFSPDRKSRVKLYIKKVFITESESLIPAYMRFLRGVIDSDDLPLNISRENLQHNSILDKIKSSVTLRVISELNKIMTKDREKYMVFWNNFGSVLKEGLCEIIDFKEKLLDVCLFYSALHQKPITLNEYIENMISEQNNIFYVCVDENEDANNLPQIKGFLKRNIDVLVFNDTVDDFWVNVQNEYKNKEFKSITRSGIDLDKFETKEEHEKNPTVAENPEIIVKIKEILGPNILDVVSSKKLDDIPACISVPDGAMDVRMEKYLRDQKQINKSYPKIMEINFSHPVILGLGKILETDEAEDLIKIIYEQACIVEGENLQNKAEFAKRLTKILEKLYN